MSHRFSEHAVLTVVFATLAVAACGPSTSGATEGANADCSPNAPASGPVQFGNGTEGASCQHASDCAASCCSCANGNKYLASECVGGSCASAQTACDDEEKLFKSQGFDLCQ